MAESESGQGGAGEGVAGAGVTRGKFLTEVVGKRRGFSRVMFIDQLRGLVIMILVLNLAGGPFEEVIPKFLVHGNNDILNAWENPVISLIDIGAAIFGFITGLGMCISFNRLLAAGGARKAWHRVLKRVAWFLLIPGAITAVNLLGGDYMSGNTFHVDQFFWDWFADNIFIQVLVAGLGSVLAVQMFPRDPDKRFKFLVIPLWALVAALHFIPAIRFWNDEINGEAFPFTGYIAYAVYGIVASCLWDWVNPWALPIKNPWKEPIDAFKNKIFPLLAACVVIVFVLGFLQYPSHKGNGGTMMGIVIWSSTGLFAFFYFMVEKARFSLRLLGWLGKNPLICYIGVMVWNVVYALLINIGAADLVSLDIIAFGAVYGTNAIPFSIANVVALGFIVLPLFILIFICYLLDKHDVKISG